MSDTNKIGICLLSIPDKEAAVLTRIITFAQSQGKTYQLVETPEQAQFLIVHGDKVIDTWKDSHQIIRIASQTQHTGEHLLRPPLLITRAMRTLDQVISASSTAHSPGLQSTQQSNTTNTPPKTTSIETAVATSDSSPKQPHRALIVDDSAAIRKQLELELRHLGISSDGADSGEQALQRVAQNDYALIFLDVIMPGIDGYETCSRLRQRPANRKTPIIMLSAKDSPLDEVQGVLAGATTYLTKPVKKERLEQTVKRVLNWLNEYAKK